MSVAIEIMLPQDCPITPRNFNDLKDSEIESKSETTLLPK